MKTGVSAEAGVDPRVELFGAVQTLARATTPPAALADFAAGLAAHRSHPAVAAYARLGAEEALGLIAQCLSADARLTWRRPRALLSEDFLTPCGGAAGLEELLVPLRDFARRARFFARLQAAAPAYTESTAAARRALAAGAAQAEALERYVGAPLDARLRFVLCGLYRPGSYNSYILPYPYPRPDEAAPPEGPYEVITLLAPGGGREAALSRPLESGLLQELVYCWAEPFVWAHRAVLFGGAPQAGRQYELTRAVVDAISVRAAARAGLAPGVIASGAASARALSALARFESGPARPLADFAPELARALAGERAAK